jgi:outer membrane protein
MTKFVQKFAITAVMALAVFTQSAQAQKGETLKIAMVDVNTVVSTMPEYLDASQKIQTQTKAYQDSLQIMKTKFQTTKDTYDKLGAAASDDVKKKETEELTSLQDVYSKFYDEKFNQQTGELATMQQNLMKPILQKIQNALDAFRAKEHLSFIIPKGSVVSTDPAFDVTTKFSDYLKAQK